MNRLICIVGLAVGLIGSTGCVTAHAHPVVTAHVGVTTTHGGAHNHQARPQRPGPNYVWRSGTGWVYRAPTRNHSPNNAQNCRRQTWVPGHYVGRGHHRRWVHGRYISVCATRYNNTSDPWRCHRR